MVKRGRPPKQRIVKSGAVQDEGRILNGRDEPILPDNYTVFRPNPGPQTQFLEAPERVVLFGGAAGGGKSYAMLSDPIRYFDNKNFSGIILRRTNDELRDLINESKKIYLSIYPKAVFRERDHTWIFPSGARLWMSYLDRDDDVYRYQGQAFQWIGFDELTQWPTPFPFNYMLSRLRSSDPKIPLYMRASANPGGAGGWWVKKMFIDPAPYNTPFWAQDAETGEVLVDSDPDSKDYNKPLFKMKFIPSKLSDNPYLAKDGEYRRNLMALPEHQRKQLLEGNWDSMEGAAFSEFNRRIHVVDPFEVPRGWSKFRACDYGYGSHSGVLWFAISPDSQLVIYREMYVSKVLAVDLADEIRRVERDDGNVLYGVLDSSLWHSRGDRGPSLAEQMISRGTRWRPSDRSKGSRVSGKNEIHRLLKVDDFTEEPGLVIFNTCTNLIAQLPALPLDKKNPEDVDTNYAHDHLYDALRYGVMTRPRPYDWGEDEFGASRQETYSPIDATFGY